MSSWRHQHDHLRVDDATFSIVFKDKNEPPSVPSELQENADDAKHAAKERQPDVVSDESGRTLAVTLHEVRWYHVVGELVEYTYAINDPASF